MLKAPLVEIPGKEIRLFISIRDGCGDRPCFVEYVMGRLSKSPMRPEHDAGWSKIKNEGKCDVHYTL